MTTDPQEPHRGYALTPGITSSESTTPDAASTAHHEELLRTEALAAHRGNLAIAKFAAIGLLAAFTVGFVTWRSSIPDTDGTKNTHHQKVADASSDPTTHGDPMASASVQPPRTSPQNLTPIPEGGIGFSGGVAPLSEDPYLPPNAWDGGQDLHPTGSPAEDVNDPVLLSPTTTSRPTIPTIPGFPPFPSITAETNKPTEAGESGAPNEPREQSETTNSHPIISNRSEPTPIATKAQQY